MKRQKFRRSLILLSFLLFPITMYYFSPYLIIAGAFEGIITGSFIVFVAMFVYSLLFGRLFCGWICPAAGLQEACFQVSPKKARGGRFNYIKYFIWLPWLLVIIFGFFSYGGINKINFLYQTKQGISISQPRAYIIFYVVIICFTSLSFAFGKRAGCHYICWMSPFMIIGSKLGKVLHLPALHLEAEKDNCVHCKACAKKCPMSLDIDQMAASNNINDSECILCGECVDTCPKKVIHYKFSRKK